MMRRKLAILLLGLVMLLSIFAGCSDKEEATKDDVTATEAKTEEKSDVQATDNSQNDIINLDSMNLPIIRDSENFPKMTALIKVNSEVVVPVGEMAQVKRLADATGVVFDWIEIPSQGGTEKVNLMISSGDLPDIFWGSAKNEMVIQYMGQEVFIPTEDLADQYMPRLTAIFEKRPEYKAGSTAPDGHRYGFPYIEEMYGLVLTPGPFLINQEWLDQLDLPMPSTVDEWVDTLRAFKAAGDLNGNGVDDEIPYALSFTSTDTFGSLNTFHMFTGAFGQADTYGGNRQNDHMRVIDDKIVFTAADEAYRKTIEFFYGLNQEGLIDVDSFSPHPNSGSALYLDKIKGDEAVIGCFGVWAPSNELPNIDVRKQYVSVPRLEGEAGKTGHALNFTEMQKVAKVAISTKCEYPEVVACFVDYLYEPELSITTNWGAEGYVYMKGDDGILHFDVDADNNIVLKDGYQNFSEMRNNTTPNGALAVLNEYYGTVADYTWDAVDLLAFQRASGKEAILEEYTPVPTILMTQEEQAKISQIQPQIKNIVSAYTITGVLDGGAAENWDQYLKDLDDAGLEELLAIFQGAYDRYLDAQ